MAIARLRIRLTGDGGSGLTYAETVAIGKRRKPSFTRYRKRDVGVNLRLVGSACPRMESGGESTTADP